MIFSSNLITPLVFRALSRIIATRDLLPSLIFCGGLIGLVSSHCRPPSSFFHAFFHPAPISCLVVQYQASCLLWFKVFRAGRLNRQRDDPIESRAHAFQPINAEEWAGPKGKPLLLLKEPLGALLQPHLSEPSVKPLSFYFCWFDLQTDRKLRSEPFNVFIDFFLMPRFFYVATTF